MFQKESYRKNIGTNHEYLIGEEIWPYSQR